MSILANSMITEAAYSDTAKQLVQEDQMKVAEMKTEVERAEREIVLEYGSTLTIETALLRQWLAKFPYFTMKNIAPYTTNGDINNAIYCLPVGVNSRDLRPWLIDWRPFDLFVPNNAYVWETITGAIGEYTKTPQEMIRRAKLDKPRTGSHRRQQLEKYFLTTFYFTTTSTCNVNGYKQRGNWQNKRQATEAGMLPYRDFAERMAKCTADFEKFCQEQ